MGLYVPHPRSLLLDPPLFKLSPSNPNKKPSCHSGTMQQPLSVKILSKAAQFYSGSGKLESLDSYVTLFTRKHVTIFTKTGL